MEEGEALVYDMDLPIGGHKDKEDTAYTVDASDTEEAVVIAALRTL